MELETIIEHLEAFAGELEEIIYNLTVDGFPATKEKESLYQIQSTIKFLEGS